MYDDDVISAAGMDLRLSAAEERILDGARRCFDSIGPSKTRIDDIATEAGLSRQTVYKYFSGKREIIDRIGHVEMIRVNALIRDRVDRGAAFPDKLAQAIAISVEIARENPYLRRTVEDPDLYPQVTGSSLPIYVWQRAQWNGILERARKSGELAPDLGIDQVVHWILLCQMILVMAPEKLPVRDMSLQDYVRRFMIEPLLSQRSRQVSSDQLDLLRRENQALKDLVARQALELHSQGVEAGHHRPPKRPKVA